jgi:hypothetical protein
MASSGSGYSKFPAGRGGAGVHRHPVLTKPEQVDPKTGPKSAPQHGKGSAAPKPAGGKKAY